MSGGNTAADQRRPEPWSLLELFPAVVPAERLSREALFLLVFGSRPAIRTALLTSLTDR
jgi:hypothetical protein